MAFLNGRHFQEQRRLTTSAPDAGALRVRKTQAVSHALSFFWLDGFAVPAPAQVTQTVRQLIQL